MRRKGVFSRPGVKGSNASGANPTPSAKKTSLNSQNRGLTLNRIIVYNRKSQLVGRDGRVG